MFHLKTYLRKNKFDEIVNYDQYVKARKEEWRKQSKNGELVLIVKRQRHYSGSEYCFTDVSIIADDLSEKGAFYRCFRVPEDTDGLKGCLASQMEKLERWNENVDKSKV